MAQSSQIDHRLAMLQATRTSEVVTMQGVQREQKIVYWVVPYRDWLTLPLLHDDIITAQEPFLAPGPNKKWSDMLIVGVPDHLPQAVRHLAARTMFLLATKANTPRHVFEHEVRDVINLLPRQQMCEYLEDRASDLAGYWHHSVQQGFPDDARSRAEEAMMIMLRLRTEFLAQK